MTARTEDSRLSPGPRPRTYMCQKWKLRLTAGSNGIVATGCTSSWPLKSSSSTPVASSEKKEKLTPPSSTVAPSGWGWPRSNVGSRSTIERRRVRFVRVALVELNDVSFRVRDPDNAHVLDERAHVERPEGGPRVLAHLGQLAVDVVDQKGDVAPARVGRAVVLSALAERLALGGEELERDTAVPDHDDLVGAGEVDAQTLEAEVLGIPALDRDRVLAVEPDVVHRPAHRSGRSASSSMIRWANRWQWPPLRAVTR